MANLEKVQTTNSNKEPIPINKKELKKKTLFNNIKFILSLIFVLIVLALVGCYYIYSISYTTVVVDANASINLKLNKWDKVIGVSALDANGNNLIEAESLKYKSIDDALIIIINKAEAYDYIHSSNDKNTQPVTVYISGNSVNVPKFYAEANTKNYDIQINENGVETFDNFDNNSTSKIQHNK